MAARIIHALGSGVCEALPVQLVNDILFLNERGKRLGYYTVCLCWGSTGPLYAGYMLAGGYSWRLYFYVLIAFAGALFIAAFLFVEESSYKRNTEPRSSGSSNENIEKETAATHVEAVPVVPPRKTFLQTLKPWSGIDNDAQFFMTMARAFTYFLVPSVLWVVTSFGTLHHLFSFRISPDPQSQSLTHCVHRCLFLVSCQIHLHILCPIRDTTAKSMNKSQASTSVSAP